LLLAVAICDRNIAVMLREMGVRARERMGHDGETGELSSD
jgi:hypothetical protein